MLALTAADPIALQRFVLDWDDVGSLHRDVRVVVSKARSKAAGGDPATVRSSGARTLRRGASGALLPDARDALDVSVLESALLARTDPENAYAVAVTALAAEFGAAAPATSTTSRSRRLRRRRA